MTINIANPHIRKSPWERCATLINEDKTQYTASEFITKAGLDWTVAFSQMHATVITDHGVTTLDVAEPLNKVATTRINHDGTASLLGMTSPTYSIVQNLDIAEMVDAVMYEAGALYHSAGELKGGRKIFLTAKLPDEVEIAAKGIDPIETLLVVTNTHDGTDALRFQVMHLRLLCTNGMTGWVKSNSIGFRHSSRMDVKLQDVRDTLQLVLKETTEFNELAAGLLNKKVSNGAFWQIVQQLMPVDEDATDRQKQNVEARRQAVMGIWNGDTQENIKGTAWGAVHAFSEYEQWAVSGRSSNDQIRAERFMLNQGNRYTDMALALV